MVTRVELERANAQLHAHFLALSGQIFGELSQLERLIASRPPAARVSGLATAAEIASAQRQLRAQIDRLPSSSLQRYESLRSALDAQQGVLRQLSFIVEQHTPAQRRVAAPGASAARPPGLAPEARRQQSVPRNPTPAAQEQIPRVYTSPAPPAQQYSAPAEEYSDQPTASSVRNRDAKPAWSRHLRRLRVGSHSRTKTASPHRLLAIARNLIYPAVTGVGARSLGLLAMVVAGAVVSYGMFPYASEQPNAAVKQIVTRKIDAGALPVGAPAPLPLVAVALAPAAVAPDAGVDALKRFGMLGRVAVDCSAPDSPRNPHQIFAVARGGNITRTFKTNNPKFDAALPLRNVRMLTPDLLQFEETGRASELTVTMIKIDGKFRNWHSIQADGTVLIADGKFSNSGKPTIAFRFCGS